MDSEDPSDAGASHIVVTPSMEADVVSSDANGDEQALDLLRGILLEQSRARIEELQTEIDKLQHVLELLEEQVNDDDALIATITPVIANAISTSIHDSRDEMIEALYPITGRLVSKAVTESMRDLVRNIDSQMRSAFSFAGLTQQVKARASGVSHAEMTLRSALPFTVEDLFLIHRDSGLLIDYLSRTGHAQADSDLISGMLTAIRDFVQDAFVHSTPKQNAQDHLDEIHYGDLRILIEVGKYTYVAAVVQGFEPMGYRSQIRDALYRVEHNNFRTLRRYDGNTDGLVSVHDELHPLMVEQLATRDAGAAARQAALSARQQRKGWTPRVIFFVVLCCVVLCLFLWRMWTILNAASLISVMIGFPTL